ncbi:hypothetical protein AMECASPLE_036865, partial [Ameca splendens]
GGCQQLIARVLPLVAELPEPDFALSIVCCFGFLTSGDKISSFMEETQVSCLFI